MDPMAPSWSQWKQWLADEPLPCAVVHLPSFDENVRRIRDRARACGKKLRVASKSVRSVALLRRIFEGGGEDFQGVMCFTVPEAAKLSDEGFRDLLVAYPSVQPSDTRLAASLAKRNVGFKVVVDSPKHLAALSAEARRAGTVIDTVLELDVSYRRLGGRVHLGPRRSPVRNAERAVDLAREARQLGGVRVSGLMAYEAQIAGVTDANPFTMRMNPVTRAVKLLSVPDVARKRAAVVAALRNEGFELDLVNGGGTGSLDSTGDDDAVTELTAGSGFYCPHLFSYYRGLRLLPAAFFVLQVVRASDAGFVTCASGGFVASGALGMDKLPLAHLPSGLKLVAMEGAGEVQTPLATTECVEKLGLGDPVLFRHAKAGELCERFNELVLVGENGIRDRVPTYRGQGWCFG